jgi:hypothetical protein
MPRVSQGTAPMPFDAAADFALLSNLEILALALSRPGVSILRQLEAVMVARIAERDRMALTTYAANVAETREHFAAQTDALMEQWLSSGMELAERDARMDAIRAEEARCIACEREVYYLNKAADLEPSAPELPPVPPAPDAQPQPKARKPRRTSAPKAEKPAKRAKAPRDTAALIRANQKIRRDALKTPVQYSYGAAWATVENPLLQCRLAAMEARHGKPIRGDEGYQTHLSTSGEVYAVSLVSAGVWTIRGADWVQWSRDARDELAAEGRAIMEERLAAEAARVAADRAAEKAQQAARDKAAAILREHPAVMHKSAYYWRPAAFVTGAVVGSWYNGNHIIDLNADGTATVWDGNGPDVVGTPTAAPEELAQAA